MLSFIKGLFGSKKPTSTVESQPHPLDIAKYTPATPTQENADKVLAAKEWPFQTPTQTTATEPIPVAETKTRKPRAKKTVATPVKTAVPVAKPKAKPRAKK